MREETGGGTCPECGTTGARPGQLVCQGCYVPFALMTPARRGAGPADTAPPADPHRDPTRFIGPLPNSESSSAKTRRDTSPRALRLRFPGDQVVSVEPGRHIRLGREPGLCPAVRFLAAHHNLSRLHATVTVEPDGAASITDEGSMNGTFLRGYRLPPNEPAVLNPGDVVRLAADVTVRVLP